MKLLHIDSSALGANSVTRDLSAAVVARWQNAVPGLSVEYRDLDANPVPHLTGGSLAGANAEEAADAAAIMEQFLAADVVVVGAPMYNFGIPSTLKAWIDRVAVAGKTFRYTENGPEGLAVGKKVIVASGRGGLHTGAPSDFQEPYLTFVLGFLGITDVEFVRAEGVAYSPEHRANAIAGAKDSISAPLALAA
ncbi:FMN-dependent NADH-azoreductase [Lysobacter daejeonensis GH1-9]|uniref:FMN dependent NADH:quinone oxidoreductase n=1 Tax=Lysobacter daejeonensis GH1-9 TaxID=1385517 RepID=A0A0A0EZ36_9GAMM|nr:NAD(P)H-dependent oxidoreductase [Lysobacter daejeonensis]KGM54367.1 FMN-dependent NADH-azoreductase [Lysobacter daejeonensis GH1-9]